MRVAAVIYLIVILTQPIYAQTVSPLERYKVEVATFAEPVGKDYFKDLPGVYESIDVNYIYRYYIDANDEADAKVKQQLAIEKGFVHAKVVDIQKIQESCDYYCEYVPPQKIEFIEWNQLDFDADVQVDVSRIQSIFFDYDSYRLRSKSTAELTKLGIILYQFPDYTAELRAHTDDRGENSYNLELSKKRANLAKQFLVSKGINADRVRIKSYGENAPIAKNRLVDGTDSEVGRQFNRRVELVVFDKNGTILNIVDKIYVPEELKE